MGQTFWQLPQATHSVLFTTACRFGKVILLLVSILIKQPIWKGNETLFLNSQFIHQRILQQIRKINVFANGQRIQP